MRTIANTIADFDEPFPLPPPRRGLATAGPPGFLSGHGATLHVSALPRDGDPLHEIPIGDQVGLIVIDFATRRRLRINGQLLGANGLGMTVRVGQSYGNCPKYIHQRPVDAATFAPSPSTRARHSTVLNPSEQAMIASSDTFFLGTTHPRRGSDASHRGGPPGFVRVDSPDRLWWPDFPGNNMFNSFGNLSVVDEAALLFIDFATGATLHMTGTAQVRWTTPGAVGDDGGVGRNVVFSIDAVVAVPSPANERDGRLTPALVKSAATQQSRAKGGVAATARRPPDGEICSAEQALPDVVALRGRGWHREDC